MSTSPTPPPSAPTPAPAPTTMAPSKRGSKATVAIVLVVSLFFIWGLTMNLLNTLNAPFQRYLNLNATESTLLQVAYYGAYFVMAIPAAAISKKWGYKAGIIFGLSLFFAGAVITIPATKAMSYAVFLLAMFVLAAGASTLESNANPYVTKLGDEKNESLRLNIAQSFNGVGSVVGPLIGGAVLPKAIEAGASDAQLNAARSLVMKNIGTVYLVLAAILLAVLLVFVFVHLPEPQSPDDDAAATGKGGYGYVLRIPHFRAGVLAEFLFIGAQVGGMAFFISYATGHSSMSGAAATGYLALLTALFALGRIITTPFMAKFDSAKILGIYMLLAALGALFAFLELGVFSVVALIASYLFVSIGFPTVFALSLQGLRGNAAKTGASMLVMSIVGAAIVPLLMGVITDAWGIHWAFALLVLNYIYVAWYGFSGSKLGRKVTSNV